ncbi:hypothetical protein IX317_000652 [Fusobacterium sp. DD29]|uniref:phage tail protein n=1 Tax=unclassified Fusobacterium TaxID=2648384 RepID=UPI001B8AFD0D|nr:MULTISPECIES: phage tail protein [unclassified Fusobacterium]MBR8700226.1 hypothetical protein [Fusobacterium sp. DD45]MBR8710519.1 hypothetical protein [Fusobacterium sp. DD28]MBR8748991.1 hypothetical protein [Fusobacterium sp. DD29]MBR8751031.1 hypothetical protein [Fusobacterium sp. DD26]MBR8761297.1 hypothetical protein [Fusobacterium sp. DD25]
MIKNKDLKLTDIAAESTLSDERTRLMFMAIDEMLKYSDTKVRKRLGVWDRIDNMTDEELNLMLWGFSDFRFGVSTAEKREIVRKAVLFRATKGTIGVLEDMCSMLYKGFKVSEWPEYDPEGKEKRGTFRITTDKRVVDPEEYKRLIQIINKNKNVRSHLDVVELHQYGGSKLYVGGYKVFNVVTTKEKRVGDIDTKAPINIKAYKQIIQEVSK